MNNITEFAKYVYLISFVLVTLLSLSKVVYQGLYIRYWKNRCKKVWVYVYVCRKKYLDRMLNSALTGWDVCIAFLFSIILITQVADTFPKFWAMIGVPDIVLISCRIFLVFGGLYSIAYSVSGILSYICGIQFILLITVIFSFSVQDTRVNLLWIVFIIVVVFLAINQAFINGLNHIKRELTLSMMVGLFLFLSIESAIMLSAFVDVLMRNIGSQLEWCKNSINNAIYGVIIASGIGVITSYNNNNNNNTSIDNVHQYETYVRLIFGYIIILLCGGFFLWIYQESM